MVVSEERWILKEHMRKVIDNDCLWQPALWKTCISNFTYVKSRNVMQLARKIVSCNTNLNYGRLHPPHVVVFTVGIKNYLSMTLSSLCSSPLTTGVDWNTG